MDFYKICLGGLILVCAYGAMDRARPLEVLATQQVDNAFPGGEVGVLFQVYRHRRCYTEVEMRLFDSQRRVFYLPDRVFQNVGAEGSDNYIGVVAISPKASLGVGTMRYGWTWKCNPTHWVWPIRYVLDVPVNITAK